MCWCLFLWSRGRLQRRPWVLPRRALPLHWISGAALPQRSRAVGAEQALLLSPWCVWGQAGKVLRTSVLIREVSQWGTQEEKCINPHFCLDLCYLHVGLRDLFRGEASDIFLKRHAYNGPLLVAAGGSAGVTSLFWGTTKIKWLQLLKPPTDHCYMVQTTAVHKVIFKRCHQRRRQSEIGLFQGRKVVGL